MKKMFLEQQNSILEWFLKDHVTLKTGVMAAEKQALSSRKKNYIKNTIKSIYFLNLTDPKHLNSSV